MEPRGHGEPVGWHAGYAAGATMRIPTEEASEYAGARGR